MEKKVLIVTDLEGVSGIALFEEIHYETEEYKKSCEKLIADTNAAVEGCFMGGATEVYVVDGHGGGENFPEGMLDKRAIQIPSADACISEYAYDAVVLVGCHTMAGTEKGFLDHTQDSRHWFEYKVGGRAYGEIGQQAIVAGAFNVPVVAVTGDFLACMEAEALVPGIATASVKTGIKRNEAICIPQNEALELIKNAVCDGVKKSDEIKPYKIELPTEIELTLYRSDYCDEICENLKYVIRNGRTIRKKIDKIVCFRDILFS